MRPLLKASNSVVIAILMQTMLMVLINQMIYMSDSIEHVRNFLPVINILAIILAAIVLKSINEVGKTIKKDIEVQAMQDNLKQMEGLMQAFQSEKHEYNRHLQTIQAMIHLEEIESVIEYMDGLSEKNTYSGDIVYLSNPIITVLLNTKSKVAQSKGIKFDFAIKCDINDMSISPWDLSSVLGNLLDNAFEAVLTNEKGQRQVGLEIRYEQDEYVIYVYNNGPGISARNIQKIFNPGFTTKGSQGRGYGLFLIKNIINQYGGRIEVSSQQRTVFKVYFPGKEE